MASKSFGKRGGGYGLTRFLSFLFTDPNTLPLRDPSLELHVLPRIGGIRRPRDVMMKGGLESFPGVQENDHITHGIFVDSILMFIHSPLRAWIRIV